MKKKETRSIYKSKRQELNHAVKAKLDDLLLIQFQTANIYHPITLLTYWPLDHSNEPNTFLFSDYLAFQTPGIQLCYPRIDAETNTMQAVAVDVDTAFKNNLHNIPEPLQGLIIDPQDIDMVLVPLLAFDLRGYRVGYGKGYYDRFLSQCDTDCTKVGFSYFEAIDEIEDVNQFDVPLNLCITPHQVYVF